MAAQKRAAPLLTIRRVRARVRDEPDTIRYYERERLLPRPLRAPSRYRPYEPPAVARLRFIRQAKALGFSLDVRARGHSGAFAAPCCAGGHGTVPYEQNTQQSPAAGCSTASQTSHL